MTTIPLPQVDDDTRPFWDAAAEHRLSLPRCDSCNRFFFYPRNLCPRCGSGQLHWEDASGRGVIHSFTVARRPPAPAFADRVPYVVALIDLEEGVRFMSNVLDPPEAVSIGRCVVVDFGEVAGVSFPFFRLDVAQTDALD